MTLLKSNIFTRAYSGYAYLGSRRFMDIAAASGRTITHKPFDLRASIDAVGNQPFSQRTEANLEYFFGRELESWSEFGMLQFCSGLQLTTTIR